MYDFKTRLNIKMAKPYDAQCWYDSRFLRWTVELKHITIYWILQRVLM